jgi:hypothetical protein
MTTPLSKEVKKHAAKKVRRVEMVGAVVRFLKANPLSTSDEIFKATGYSPMVATRWVTNHMYNGQRVWRVNTAKMRREGLL